VLFVYNRLDHTIKTIEALQKNELAIKSELYIYSDASKNEKNNISVKEVRDYIKNIKGFKEVFIIEQKENFGLAKSIINGVGNIVNKYGKIIVLEDDLVTSPNFLTFMNNALDNYKNEEKVWHISGWNYPASFDTNQDVYLYRIMDCWGWATWKDKWKYFEKNTDKLINNYSKQDIKRFNLDGYTNLWRQVKLNKSGGINTWAIYWYATIFNNNGLCLNPIKSYVKNIGHDGTGEHCNISGYLDNITLNNNSDIKFALDIKEDEKIVIEVKQYFKATKKSLLVRIFNKIKTLIWRNFR
jgi:hypothetical protein